MMRSKAPSVLGKRPPRRETFEGSRTLPPSRALSDGAIAALSKEGRPADGTLDPPALLQVVFLTRQETTTPGAARYRLLLSDGRHTRPVMLATNTHHLVEGGALAPNALVRLRVCKSVSVAGKSLLIASDVEPAGENDGVLGTPSPWEERPREETPPPATGGGGSVSSLFTTAGGGAVHLSERGRRRAQQALRETATDPLPPPPLPPCVGPAAAAREAAAAAREAAAREAAAAEAAAAEEAAAEEAAAEEAAAAGTAAAAEAEAADAAAREAAAREAAAREAAAAAAAGEAEAREGAEAGAGGRSRRRRNPASPALKALVGMGFDAEARDQPRSAEISRDQPRIRNVFEAEAAGATLHKTRPRHGQHVHDTGNTFKTRPRHVRDASVGRPRSPRLERRRRTPCDGAAALCASGGGNCRHEPRRWRRGGSRRRRVWRQR